VEDNGKDSNMPDGGSWQKRGDCTMSNFPAGIVMGKVLSESCCMSLR